VKVAVSDLFNPHLASGESLLWSASASPSLRKAELYRQRLFFGLTACLCLMIALTLALRFVEALILTATTPSLLAAFTPLYLVFALAMAALALWGFRRMAVDPHRAAHFAMTPARLFALDRDGALVDEIMAGEVDGVVAGGRRRSYDLYVLRRGDPQEDHTFAMQHLERPLEVKAIIEAAFSLSTPEEQSS
jgi:hypothetical protein